MNWLTGMKQQRLSHIKPAGNLKEAFIKRKPLGLIKLLLIEQ